MLNGKAMKIHITVGLIRKISLCKMSYFPEPYNLSEIKQELIDQNLLMI